MRCFVHKSTPRTIFVIDEVPDFVAMETFCSGSNFKLDENEELIIAMQPPIKTMTSEQINADFGFV